MTFRDEAKRVSSFAPDGGKTPSKEKEKLDPRHTISRLSQPKPAFCETKKPEKEFPQTKIIHVAQEEKSAEQARWNRAALHAHHCCVSQKHPAFVHLTQLLSNKNPLNKERISLWKLQKFLLIAKRLEKFIRDELSHKPGKKRAVAPLSQEIPPEDLQKELWKDYLHAQEKKLFQLPK